MIARIFVADNDQVIHKLYCDVLEMKGHEIIGEAFDGNECVEKIQKLDGELDIVLIDHRMPLKNGFEAMKELLELKPELKIIFVSADASVHNRALVEGAASFIKKPFNLKTLYNSVEEIMR